MKYLFSSDSYLLLDIWLLMIPAFILFSNITDLYGSLNESGHFTNSVNQELIAISWMPLT